MTNQTRSDLVEDFNRYEGMLKNAEVRLRNLKASLNETTTDKSNIPIVTEQITTLERQYHALQEDIASLNSEREETPKLITKKNAIFQALRTLQGITASVLVSTDWQSPSFAYSTQSFAGSQTGNIVENESDYKRDAHLDARAYEKQFIHEFVDAPWYLPQRAHVTSSCMSALTVVASSLLASQKHHRPVLVGKHSYFQNLHIVEGLFPGRTHITNELDNETFLADIDKHRPCAIFLDSLCNVSEIGVPDLPTLIPKLAKRIRHRTTLVIDNTGLSITFQPLQYLPKLSKLSIIVVEGLNKYHQYGFDRVTSGVVWTSTLTRLSIGSFVQDVGAVLSDASTLALPKPNRAEYEHHLKRIGRNALFVADAVQNALPSSSPISHIAYPGLPNHPAYHRRKNEIFNGGFFSINLKKSFTNAQTYQKLINAILAKAKRHNVCIVGGTGFGFTHTRIYITARYAAKHVTPFIRVSVGSETLEEITRVKNVMIETVQTFS